MATPTFQQLRALGAQVSPTLPSETLTERLLTTMAILASGQNPDGSNAPGGGLKILGTTSVTSSPTTTSAAFGVITAFDTSVVATGGPLIVIYSGHVDSNTAAVSVYIQLLDSVSGVFGGITATPETNTAKVTSHNMTIVRFYTPTAGTRTIRLQWATDSGTATMSNPAELIVIG